MYTALKEKIVSRLRASEPLMRLLADAEAIYYRRPPKTRELPCLTYHLEDEPVVTAHVYGVFRVHLLLNIWSDSGDTNDAILAALDAALYDAHRDGSLDTAQWRVASCRRVRSRVAAGGRADDAGAEIERRETRWVLEVRQK